MRRTLYRFLTQLAALIVFATAGGWSASWAEDIPGASDHLLVGRYAGSSIAFFKQSTFDEAALLQAPHDYAALLDADRLADRSGEDWLRTAGTVTAIRYEIPVGRSSLEVLRNYEQRLTANGFEKLFSCADRDCFTGRLQDPYLLGQQIDSTNGVSTAYFDHARYLLASRRGPEGTAYASILTGEDKGRVTAFVQVVETKAMEADQIVFIDATKMAQEIEETGKAYLYGILFDFNSDAIKPESKPTLNEIAAMLRADPRLRLAIVGHTDNVGTPNYNMDLSQRRAASVVAALADEYAIESSRLTFSGAGLTEPIASNDNEEGRAKNRRVELRAE